MANWGLGFSIAQPLGGQQNQQTQQQASSIPSNVSFSPAPNTVAGGNQGGEVKQLPFSKNTTSTPNMQYLDPAMQARMGYIQGQTPQDYSSYFNQISQFAYDDANRAAAQMASAHGGAPTAQTGNTGMAQAALQSNLYEQLNRQNVQRMWTSQDDWNKMMTNAGLSAYGDYFNAIANKAYNTSEEGFNSGIYQGGRYTPFDPYANTSLRQGDPSSNSSSFDSPGGSATPGGGNKNTGGGSTPGGASQPSDADKWNSTQPNYWTNAYGEPDYQGYLDSLANGGYQYPDYADWWNQPGYPGGPSENLKGTSGVVPSSYNANVGMTWDAVNGYFIKPDGTRYTG